MKRYDLIDVGYPLLVMIEEVPDGTYVRYDEHQKIIKDLVETLEDIEGTELCLTGEDAYDMRSKAFEALKIFRKKEKEEKTDEEKMDKTYYALNCL